jgi:hypothetical protein
MRVGAEELRESVSDTVLITMLIKALVRGRCVRECIIIAFRCLSSKNMSAIEGGNRRTKESVIPVSSVNALGLGLYADKDGVPCGAGAEIGEATVG